MQVTLKRSDVDRLSRPYLLMWESRLRHMPEHADLYKVVVNRLRVIANQRPTLRTTLRTHIKSLFDWLLKR